MGVFRSFRQGFRDSARETAYRTGGRIASFATAAADVTLAYWAWQHLPYDPLDVSRITLTKPGMTRLGIMCVVAYAGYRAINSTLNFVRKL